MSMERIPRNSVSIRHSAEFSRNTKKGQGEINSQKADLPVLTPGIEQISPYCLDWVDHGLS